MNNHILVVGSSNTDLVLKAKRLPKPGETILGGNFFTFQGGKGANQAVAAARLGGQVKFICKVGADAFGNEAVAHFQKEGIDVQGVLQDTSAPTGVALITINAEGENTIVVASGANALLSIADLENATAILEQSDFIITQLESPMSVVSYLAAYSVQMGKKMVLNPAPAAVLDKNIFKDLFLITPNETETELLTGFVVSDEASAKNAAQSFKEKGVQNVIITMGSKGAYVSCLEFEGLVPALQVDAVDTTAAGDVFNGALVVGLSKGKSWKDSVLYASKAASISVTRLGAQTSAPYQWEVE